MLGVVDGHGDEMGDVVVAVDVDDDNDTGE